VADISGSKFLFVFFSELWDVSAGILIVCVVVCSTYSVVNYQNRC